MRDTGALLFLLLSIFGSAAPARADSYALPVHITSQTTTTIVTAVAGQRVHIYYGALCVDANGAATGIKIQDSGGTNLLGTNVVYVVAPGQCLKFDALPGIAEYPYLTGSGLSLQVVTTVGNGPVNGTLVGVQR